MRPGGLADYAARAAPARTPCFRGGGERGTACGVASRLLHHGVPGGEGVARDVGALGGRQLAVLPLHGVAHKDEACVSPGDAFLRVELRPRLALRRELPQAHADRPHVALLLERVPSDLLGRHVGRRPRNGSRIVLTVVYLRRPQHAQARAGGAAGGRRAAAGPTPRRAPVGRSRSRRF